MKFDQQKQVSGTQRAARLCSRQVGCVQARVGEALCMRTEDSSAPGEAQGSRSGPLAARVPEVHAGVLRFILRLLLSQAARCGFLPGENLSALADGPTPEPPAVLGEGDESRWASGCP